MGNTGTPARRVAVFFAAAAVATVVPLVAVEIAFRLFMDVTDVPLYTADPFLGFRRAPNQSGRYLTGDHVRGRYTFNSQGWNHRRDYRVRKPAGITRIALVGDSQVESMQVDPGETMYVVAESLMHRPDRPVEWHAFGTSGYGTSQEYDVVRRYALDYQPDVVILLFVQNDLFDISPYLVTMESYIPTYSLDEDGRLTFEFPATQWSPRWTHRVVIKSAVGRYFFVQRKVLDRIRAVGQRSRQNIGGLPLRSGISTPSAGSIAGLDSMSTRERQRRSWLLIGRLLEAARDESARRGATFAVAFRGWWGDIDAPLGGAPAPLPPPESDPYCLEGRTAAMGPQCLEPIARELGIPYIDLAVPLRAAVAATRRSHRFPDDYHYSADGHRAAGHALAAFADSLLAARISGPSARTR